MWIGWHEPLECSEQSLITFAQQRLVAALSQRLRDVFNRLAAIFLPTRLTEPVDHARTIMVPNDGYPHELLPCIFPSVTFIAPLAEDNSSSRVLAQH
ncbi:hypothetical protein X768_23195 [Mesorhizobium sp. LSJC265A00]|nr:hypothetical protein X768_23195 [Mesorhizobium sp. LSJC265A00]